MSSQVRLHPEVQALLARFEQLGARPLHELGVEGARKAVRGSVALQGASEPVASVWDLAVLGSAGWVPLRVYHPRPDTPLPVVVYLHGGGWVTGGIEEADRPCRSLAVAWQCVVVSVGYRLSPEVHAPAALEDVTDILWWLQAHRAALGADPSSLTVLGESAGGTLAAGAALTLVDQGITDLVTGLVLFYPPLAAPTPDPSRATGGLPNTLTVRDMEWFWNLYLGPRSPDPRSHVAPLSSPDLHGLPSTVVVTAEADILRDDGARFVARLRASGVTTFHLDVPGMVHGFLGMLGALPSARTVLLDVQRLVPVVNTSVDRSMKRSLQ